ncbi:hypothetical protein B0H10DRAFT_1997073 [Mycena sp. CBHHK59/15]|nr:hypothetical protein B0H10DRAFT_1997073 [Mycena sp. CBHHK59/15]
MTSWCASFPPLSHNVTNAFSSRWRCCLVTVPVYHVSLIHRDRSLLMLSFLSHHLPATQFAFIRPMSACSDLSLLSPDPGYTQCLPSKAPHPFRLASLNIDTDTYIDPHAVSPDVECRSISPVSSQLSHSSDSSRRPPIVGFGCKHHHHSHSLHDATPYSSTKRAASQHNLKLGYRRSLPISVIPRDYRMSTGPKRKLEYRVSLDQDSMTPPVFEPQPSRKRHSQIFDTVSDNIWGSARQPPKPLRALFLPGRASRFVRGQLEIIASSRSAKLAVSHYTVFVTYKPGRYLVSRFPSLAMEPPRLRPLKPIKLLAGVDGLRTPREDGLQCILQLLEDWLYRWLRNILWI